MATNIVELKQVPPELVKNLLQKNDRDKVTAAVHELAKIFSSTDPDNSVYPFLLVVGEFLEPQEILRHEAVNTLISQQEYWKAFHNEIKNNKKSLADYLKLVSGLAIVHSKDQYLVKLITYIRRDNEKRLNFLSIAGDGDFWNGLENNEISTMMPLDPIYGTNHHPIIPLSELGIKPENTNVLLSASSQLFNQFIHLFSKITQILKTKGEILEGIRLSDSYNPANIAIALIRLHNDSDKAGGIYNQFREKFNDYVTSEEWNVIFSSLEIMDQELGKLIQIGKANIKDA